MGDEKSLQDYKDLLKKTLGEMSDAEYAQNAAFQKEQDRILNEKYPAPPVEEREPEPVISVLRVDSKKCDDRRYLVEFFVDDKKICDITAFLGGVILKRLLRIIKIFCVVDVSCGLTDQVFLRYKNEKIGIGFTPVTMYIYNQYYGVNRDPVMGLDLTFFDKKKNKRRREYIHGDRRKITKALYDFIVRVDPTLRDKDLEDIFMLNFTDHFDSLSKGHFTDYERAVRDDEDDYHDEYKIGFFKSVAENVEVQKDETALVVFKVDNFSFTFLDEKFKKHKKRYKGDKNVELHLALFCSNIEKVTVPNDFDKDDLHLEPTESRAVYKFCAQIQNIETDGVFDYNFIVHSIRKTPKLTYYSDGSSIKEYNSLLMRAYINDPAETHLKDSDFIKGVCCIKATD